jgi:cytochrome P450
VHFDPTDPAFVADPYPTYARLRREDPVSWDGKHGLWLVSRHADVDALLRDRRLGRVFVPHEPRDELAAWNVLNEHSMLELEPPEHTRLRRLVAGAFTRTRVERLRPRVAELADGLLDEFADAGGGDLLTALAAPLPVEVIAELLGVPREDRHLLRPWSGAIVELYELEPAPGATARAVTAAREFDRYLRDLLAVRRREPGDDLLSALAVQAHEGDRLTTDELVATAVLLLNAGHEASVNVIGNGILALLRNPGELARLRAGPALVGTAVEELIRYDTPLSLFTRTAFTDVDVAGRVVRAGDRVGLLLGAANRDPAVFAGPDRLDVGRDPNPHLGFGAGIHYCLGAPLARIELQEALGRLLARFPVIELAEEPEVRPAFQFRGYRSLHVVATEPSAGAV